MKLSVSLSITWIAGLILGLASGNDTFWLIVLGSVLSLIGFYPQMRKTATPGGAPQMSEAQAATMLTWMSALLLGVGIAIGGWALTLGGLAISIISYAYYKNFCGKRA